MSFKVAWEGQIWQALLDGILSVVWYRFPRTSRRIFCSSNLVPSVPAYWTTIPWLLPCHKVPGKKSVFFDWSTYQAKEYSLYYDYMEEESYQVSTQFHSLVIVSTAQPREKRNYLGGKKKYQNKKRDLTLGLTQTWFCFYSRCSLKAHIKK